MIVSVVHGRCEYNEGFLFLQCIENLSRSNCPICQEDIHTSREPSQIPPCNHLIHKSCFDQLVKSGHYFCPTCSRSLVDMREMWKFMDAEILETPLPAVYQVNIYRKMISEIRNHFCIDSGLRVL